MFWSLFLSTPSARRATLFQFFHKIRLGVFLSTPSARRATSPHQRVEGCTMISIHALREEGDVLAVLAMPLTL